MLIGIELALAVLPLVISAAEHSKEAIQKVKALTSNKAKSERQLDFFYEISDELALLRNTLRGLVHEETLAANGTSLWPLTSNELQQIDETLGDNAGPFREILRRLLKSFEDLVSDKSLSLEENDVQSSTVLYKKLERFKTQINVEEIRGSLLARIRFIRNEKSRAVALRRIREANVKLERLLRYPLSPENVCRMIHQAHGRQSTLHMIYDHEKLWQMQSRKGSLSRQKQKDMTLKDLLTDPSRRIKLKEQRILAVTLTHAALHCSNGPWSAESWTKEHITFSRNDSTTEPDISRPFFKVRFEGDYKNTNSTRNLFSNHSSPAWLSLGILLLEIHLKGPIEARWTEEDLIEGQPSENTNLTTAWRLIQNDNGEIYEGYRQAVQACLEYDNQDGGKDDLRHKVYNEIIWPLEQELYVGWKIKPEDLQLAPLGLSN
ncbi:MAG: hypothetical protein Q9165_003840 [Trypethelium subeluteriae]